MTGLNLDNASNNTIGCPSVKDGRIKIEDFGSDIYVYKKKVNEIKENVLVEYKHLKELSSNIPINNAINKIVNNLENIKAESLNGFQLKDIFNTMKTMWKGKELYEASFE